MRLLVLVIACLLPFAAHAEKPLPRVLAAFYDSREEANPHTTQIHRFLEMPANYYGYDIHYYDVTEPLPDLGDEIAGIVLWFNVGVSVPDIDSFLTWLTRETAEGKKLIMIENSGLGDEQRKNPEIMRRWNDVLRSIGLQDDNVWNEITYNASVQHADPDMMGFERRVGPLLPPVSGKKAIAGLGTSHLQVRIKTADEYEQYDLVTTSPHGGYIAPGYALFHVVGEDKSDVSQWYVNPFLFLKKSLNAGLAPIPDVTTLDGRRIFYSHIDGDGWNNISEISAYQKRSALAADVIYHEILKAYSEFAFNVGLITGDTDTSCYGVADSARVAREIFALPNVEPSSHTHTHPLYWEFFTQYSPSREKQLLSHYPPKPSKQSSMLANIKESMTPEDWPEDPPELATQPKIKRGRNEESTEEILKKYFDTPRSYACKPFKLDEEISGSLARVNALAPEHKKVKLIQWSGDTSPFEAAIAKSREAGVLNINGGDSRFDKEYPSYSSVAPIGLQVGKERQIYSSNSNENTYTHLWTGRFFGFRYLKTTVQNTESPMRISPFNIYFHIFSGQKEASLNAVKENLDFARTQPVIPILASRYAEIAGGFYSTSVIPAGENAWHVVNRNGLQTLRFNQADNLSVDLEGSRGVLGQFYYQNNLYVALNPVEENTFIVLKNNPIIGKLPHEDRAYLLESTWEIKTLQTSKNALTFNAQGYGPGVMRWKVPSSGSYLVKLSGQKDTMFEKNVTVGDDTILFVTFDQAVATETVAITITAQ